MNTNASPSARVRHVQQLYTYFPQGKIQEIVDGVSSNIEWRIMGAPLLTYAGVYNSRTLSQFF